MWIARTGILAGANTLVGDFELIDTVTVGAAGATSISFNSIPQTYRHLQLRFLVRSDRAGTVAGSGVNVQFSGDTGNNYAYIGGHLLYGDGSAMTSMGAVVGNSAQGSINSVGATGANASTSLYGAAISDILDYSSTTKFKTVRNLSGSDANGSGFVGLGSFVWMNAAAITSMIFVAGGAVGTKFMQHSTISVYGVK